jgi:hypothetical protein
MAEWVERLPLTRVLMRAKGGHLPHSVALPTTSALR